MPAEHCEYNKAQVCELLTAYGPISELWFDMGSYTPEQSREMYALVHELQPDCMVSGRLGNDACDFAVMSDNAHPDRALQMPWQMPAPTFPGAWGARSWQGAGGGGGAGGVQRNGGDHRTRGVVGQTNEAAPRCRNGGWPPKREPPPF